MARCPVAMRKGGSRCWLTLETGLAFCTIASFPMPTSRFVQGHGNIERRAVFGPSGSWFSPPLIANEVSVTIAKYCGSRRAGRKATAVGATAIGPLSDLGIILLGSCMQMHSRSLCRQRHRRRPAGSAKTAGCRGVVVPWFLACHNSVTAFRWLR